MKKTIKIMLGLLIAVIGIYFAACSSDNDDPQSAGEKALAELNERLYVDGQFRFTYLDSNDEQYYGYTVSKEEAKEKAEYMVGHELIDDAYTLTLPDDYGVVMVIPNEDPTIFFTMYISIKGETPKICNIVDIEWFNVNAFLFPPYIPPEKLL